VSSSRWLLRAGLAGLGGLHLAWGIGAIAAPRWFFETFPGFGQRWTAAYPPFNEHLLVDVGAAFAALGVLLLLAAVLADRRVVAVALAGVLVFSGVHLAYHVLQPGGLGGGSWATSLVALVAGVIAPLGLLWLSRRAGRRADRLGSGDAGNAV
jgi:hypothetical protein